MSVQVNQYLGYGYLLPYDQSMDLLSEKYTSDGVCDLIEKYEDSAYDNQIVEINGFSLLSDGMSGAYNFFGKIFVKSQNNMPCKTTVIPNITDEMKIALENEYQHIFGDKQLVDPAVLLLRHTR